MRSTGFKGIKLEEGDVLVELDLGDFQIALDRARAELSPAEADALAANALVPITATTSKSGVVSAEGGVEQSQAAVDEAQHNLDALDARLAAVRARLSIVFAGPPVLNVVGAFEIVSAQLGAVLIGTFLVGLLEHRDKTIFKMG